MDGVGELRPKLELAERGACESTRARACWPSRQCAVEITMSGSKQTVGSTPCAGTSRRAPPDALELAALADVGEGGGDQDGGGRVAAGGSARSPRTTALIGRAGAGVEQAVDRPRVGLEDVARALHESSRCAASSPCRCSRTSSRCR